MRGIKGVAGLLRNPSFITGAGLFTVAVTARMIRFFSAGGVAGTREYDPSVYYTAAAALIHGRVPYRGEFVFLHPPLIALFGVPFAFLGRLTTASTGFLVENLAFMMLGGCVAVLIGAIAQRAGAPRWAGITGALVYATWSVTVAGGSSARLEPLGDFLFVCGIYLLGPGTTPSRRRLVVAGVLFGLLLNVKLWWVVPVGLVFLVTSQNLQGIRDRWAVPIAAAATAGLVALPFLVLSRGHMFTSVVSSQFGRPAVQGIGPGEFGRLSTIDRLGRMTGIEGAMTRLFGLTPGSGAIVIVTSVVCALMVATAVVALRTLLGRMLVPVLAAQAVVLLATPVYFDYYGDYLGVALALVIAAAATAAGESSRPRPSPNLWPKLWPSLWAVGAVVTMLVMLTQAGGGGVKSPDVEALRRATKDIPCIVTDSPRVLIVLDALDRSFENGCRNWVDFQGVGHGAGPHPEASIALPNATPAWKRVSSRYLGSGDAVVLFNPSVRAHLGPALVRRLTRGPLVVNSGDYFVYLTPR